MYIQGGSVAQSLSQICHLRRRKLLKINNVDTLYTYTRKYTLFLKNSALLTISGPENKQNNSQTSSPEKIHAYLEHRAFDFYVCVLYFCKSIKQLSPYHAQLEQPTFVQNFYTLCILYIGPLKIEISTFRRINSYVGE